MADDTTELASAARKYWSAEGYTPGGVIREVDYAAASKGLHPSLAGHQDRRLRHPHHRSAGPVHLARAGHVQGQGADGAPRQRRRPLVRRRPRLRHAGRQRHRHRQQQAARPARLPDDRRRSQGRARHQAAPAGDGRHGRLCPDLLPELGRHAGRIADVAGRQRSRGDHHQDLQRRRRRASGRIRPAPVHAGAPAALGQGGDGSRGASLPRHGHSRASCCPTRPSVSRSRRSSTTTGRRSWRCAPTAARRSTST